MSKFERRLQRLILLFGLMALTIGCQVVFGDYKVGNRARDGEGGQGASSAGGGSSIASGGVDSGQAQGPLTVFPSSDLFTNDLGAKAKFYVSLKYKPMASVTIPITSSNTRAGTVDPKSLSFTTEDWNAPQAVTVTGQPDPHVGDQAYSVTVGPATSDDKTVSGAQTAVSLTHIDNDSAGFFVTPTRLSATEAGQAFFSVVLNKIPDPASANVIIHLESSDEQIGKVSPATLTFTAANWSAPQTVTVTGVDDDAPGDRFCRVIVDSRQSSAPAYAGLNEQTVTVTVQDNDQAGVRLTLGPTGIDPSDTTRLRTSENGDSATFAVVLNKSPAEGKIVTFEVSSTNPDEGAVSPTSLTFTSVNWKAPQTVTVLGVDNDSFADGNQPYQVKLSKITSDDPAYGKLTPADLPAVNVINVDNDAANFAVTLLTGLDPNNAGRLLTSEQKTSAKFSVALTSKPKAEAGVGFTLTSTNTDEGSISAARLDFTADNWNVAQVVTVTGVGDDAKDGDVPYVVRIVPVSDDLAYQKLSPWDVNVINLDDDVAGITMPKLLSGIDNGTKLSTTEGGGTASFSVSLTSRPMNEVTLAVVSSNTSEGRVTPATLTFTAANYATAQIVTVTGQQDESIVDGNQPYTVTVGPSMSEDMYYMGLSQSVKVTNNDDDSAYIVPTPGFEATTTEKGGPAMFGISLHSQPTASVTLTFVSSDTNEGKVAPTSLTFTRANWSTPQNITVTGVDDAIADGDKKYRIDVKGTNTTDQNYMYAATTLTITNKDDDVAGLKVTAAANLQTTETGEKATFTVALKSQPTANVTIAVSSDNAKEGTALPASLAFTTMNWSTPQTVTVTGVDDRIADVNQSYTVSLKATSADTKYVVAESQGLINVNDDTRGIIVTSTACETGPGTTATFSVVLNSQPLGPVSIALSRNPPLADTIAPLALSFTASTWNVAQMVTVTGVDDDTMGVSTPYRIVTAPAVSAMDANYNGLNADDVDCVNTTPPAPPDP